MKSDNLLFIIFLLIIFFWGLYVTVKFKPSCGTCKKEHMCNKCKKEPMTVQSDKSCPDMLVKKGNVLMLYNSNEPTSSTNPIPFFNLDEYINYLEIQKQKGIDCPVLFIQEENNAQGENVYRVRPSPFDQQGGLPSVPDLSKQDIDKINNAVKVLDATKNNLPYNKNQYPSFDSHGQHIGEYTQIDAIHDSTSSKKISDNPMDFNWAGPTYTKQMVDSGKYVDNEITKPVLFNPKTRFLPDIPSHIPPPMDIL